MYISVEIESYHTCRILFDLGGSAPIYRWKAGKLEGIGNQWQIVPEFAAVQNKRKDIGLYKLTNIKGLRMSVRA